MALLCPGAEGGRLRSSSLAAILLLAAIALLSVGPAARSVAAPTPVALDRAAYVRLLYSLLDDVNAAQAATGPARDAAVSRALALLPDGITVRDAGGALAEVDTASLRADLESRPPNLAGAQLHLNALLDLLDPGSAPRSPPSPSPTPEPGSTPAPPLTPPLTPAYLPEGGAARPPLDLGDAGRRFDRVLADPRFAPQQASGVQQGLSRLIQPTVGYLLGLPAATRNLLFSAESGLLAAFIVFVRYRGALWSRGRYWGMVVGSFLVTTAAVFTLLTYRVEILGFLGPMSLPAIGSLGVLVALGVAVFAAANLRRVRAEAGTRLAGEFGAEAGWSTADALAAAAEAAASGDYRGAVRYRYLSTLLALDEAGRVRFDPSLTDGEYLRRLPGPLRAPLGPLAQLFERFWYGGYPATAEDYRSYQSLAATAESKPETGT